MGGLVCCVRDQSCATSDSQVRNSVRLKIHGDYFDRDTRALLAICDMAEVAAEFVIVDTFNGGNLEDSYRSLNPT